MLVKMPEKTTCIPARKRASPDGVCDVWKGGADARPHEAASGHQQDPGEGPDPRKLQVSSASR